MSTLKLHASAAALALALAGSFASPQVAFASDHESVEQKADDSYDSFLDYTHEQKEDAVAWADRQLAALNEKIDEMERDWDRSETKEDLEAVKADLARKRDAAAEELEELGDASADAWQEAKEQTRDALDSLGDAYEETRAKVAD